MKSHIIYECEYCKKESPDPEEIQRCEAAHLGLTVEERQRWHMLKEIVKRRCQRASITKNEETEQASYDAIEELLAFEKQHNLQEHV